MKRYNEKHKNDKNLLKFYENNLINEKMKNITKKNNFINNKIKTIY